MNLLTPVKNFFVSRARLYIEYALVALAIAGASWAVTTYMQNRALGAEVRQLHTTQGRLDTQLQQVIQDNVDQQKAIDEVARLRKLDHGVIQALMEGTGDLYDRNGRLRERLAELERNNDKARKLLRTPVPPAVRCVLDHTPCAQGGDANKAGAHGATGKPHAAVHPAPAGSR